MPNHDDDIATSARARAAMDTGDPAATQPRIEPGRSPSDHGGTGQEPAVLRVLVDDVRVFKDRRPAVVLRSSADAIGFVARLGGRRIDELWLDHDLIGDDTSQPLVDNLVAAAALGRPVPVDRILVHSSNIRAGHRVVQELSSAGYRVERSYAANLWRHAW